MTVEESLKQEGVSRGSDEEVWYNLPNFQKLALGRLFKDEVEKLADERYEDGYTEGAVHQSSKIQHETILLLKEELRIFFKRLEP